MDELFATGNKVWKFFESLLDPSLFAVSLENPWVGGPLVLGLLLAVALWARKRQSRIKRRQQLEELEQALADDDNEAHSLGLPEAPPEEEDWEDEKEYIPSTPALSRGGLVKDPSLSGGIIIGPESARKTTPPAKPKTSKPEVAELTDPEIEAEFAKFAEELRQKQLEVRQRHETVETPPPPEPPAPIELAAEDLVEDEEEIFAPSLSDDELDGLLALDVPGADIPVSQGEWEHYDDLEAEMEETINSLSREVEDEVDDGPAWVTEDIRPDPRERQDRLVRRLEEFQRDLEHRFQFQTLESLAQRNFELVESLRDPEQTPEFQASLREKQDTLHTLESLVFPKKSGKQ